MEWIKTARPNQLTPPGDWNVWLILAGRGFGKTRTGAEDMADWGWRHPNTRIALMGKTAADCRDTMYEGHSGLLSVLPPEAIQDYNRSLGELILINGTRYKSYSAEKPDTVRGPNNHRAWVDELCAFQYPEAFDQLMFGLRLGAHPQCIVTTTPKPTRAIRELVSRAGENVNDVRITRGSTFDNAANLSPAALAHLKERYEGTRLGRQELYAELLSDAPGALWQRSNIDANRVNVAPDMVRIVVAIDPAVSTSEGSDETGIVAAGKGIDGRFYVLSDRSGHYTPNGWAAEAIALYKRLGADRIIGEANNGGEMIENTIRMADMNVAYKAVHASRGKVTRAEPVAALYEQNRVSHVGCHPTLEDQMCIFTTDYDRKKAGYSPDRVDACLAKGTMIITDVGEKSIESVCVGDKVMTREGWRYVQATRVTRKDAKVFRIVTENHDVIATPDHKIFVDGKGFIRLDAIIWGDIVKICKIQPKQSFSKALPTREPHVLKTGHTGFILPPLEEAAFRIFTLLYGLKRTACHQFRKAMLSIMSMEIRQTIRQRTLCVSQGKNTPEYMRKIIGTIQNILNEPESLQRHGTQAKKEESGIGNTRNNLGPEKKNTKESALHVVKRLRQETNEKLSIVQGLVRAVSRIMPTGIRSRLFACAGRHSGNLNIGKSLFFAQERVLGVLEEKKTFDVYDLQIENEHEFFANGILVHNCVWALTELGVETNPGTNIEEYYAQKKALEEAKKRGAV